MWNCFSLRLWILYFYNRGQKCWENSWKQDYFSQIGCSCKIPSPLLPHSMLNKKFHPRATLYGGGGVWLKVFTRCLPTFKLNIRVLLIFSRSFVPDCCSYNLSNTVPNLFWLFGISNKVLLGKSDLINSDNFNTDVHDLINSDNKNSWENQVNIAMSYRMS